MSAAGRSVTSPQKSIILYGKKSCSTCVDAWKLAVSMKAQVTFRDTEKEPLSPEEIDALIGERPAEDLLSTRSPTFRELGLAGAKISRAKAIVLMRIHINLLRRPLFVRGSERFIGFREKELRRWLAGK